MCCFLYVSGDRLINRLLRKKVLGEITAREYMHNNLKKDKFMIEKVNILQRLNANTEENFHKDRGVKPTIYELKKNEGHAIQKISTIYPSHHICWQRDLIILQLKWLNGMSIVIFCLPKSCSLF